EGRQVGVELVGVDHVKAVRGVAVLLVLCLRHPSDASWCRWECWRRRYRARSAGAHPAGSGPPEVRVRTLVLLRRTVRSDKQPRLVIYSSARSAKATRRW